jgi:hypothetical protein
MPDDDMRRVTKDEKAKDTKAVAAARKAVKKAEAPKRKR